MRGVICPSRISGNPNIINVISAILGTPRDSSGGKTTPFSSSSCLFCASLVLIGSVFYRTARYRVELFCPPVVSVRQVTRKSGISAKRVKKTVSSSSSTTLVNRSNNPKKNRNQSGMRKDADHDKCHPSTTGTATQCFLLGGAIDVSFFLEYSTPLFVTP